MNIPIVCNCVKTPVWGVSLFFSSRGIGILRESYCCDERTPRNPHTLAKHTRITHSIGSTLLTTILLVVRHRDPRQFSNGREPCAASAMRSEVSHSRPKNQAVILGMARVPGMYDIDHHSHLVSLGGRHGRVEIHSQRQPLPHPPLSGSPTDPGSNRDVLDCQTEVIPGYRRTVSVARRFGTC